MSNKTIQPSWKNSPTFKDLSDDIASMSNIQEEIRARLNEYGTIKNGGRELTVKPGKSSMRPKIVRKQQEWKYPALEGPFLSSVKLFDVRPRTFEDTKAARLNSILLNYQFETQLNKTKLIGDIVRTMVDEGTVVVKTGWEVEYGMRIVQKTRPKLVSSEEAAPIITKIVESGKMSVEEGQALLTSGNDIQIGTESYEEEEEYLLRNHAKHEVCDTANVLIDPHCEGDITKAKFVAHEYDSDYSELVKYAYKETEDGSTGYYHNIEEVLAIDNEVSYDLNKPLNYNTFKFNDKARKKIKVVEYWGYWDIQGDGKLVPIVAEWANNTLIRLEKNPYSHQRIPFSIAHYMPVLKGTHGEPDAALLADNQESIQKYVRAAHDIASEAATGQEWIPEGMLTPVAKKQYEAGNTVFYDRNFAPEAIRRKKVDSIDKSIFDMIQMNTAEAESMSGTVPFGTGGMQSNVMGKLRSAGDAVSKREFSVLKRLSDLFVDLAKMDISMNQTYMSEEEVIRITNESFETIKRDDLQGDFDLKITISTFEKDQEQANGLKMLLQTNAASMDPNLSKLILGKILRLEQHPDLAHTVETFEPQSDPVQEETQKLRLENTRLENEMLKSKMIDIQSRVSERNSRAEENIKADVETKLAQAELRLAQAEMNAALAEKYKAEADSVDQDTLLEVNGVKRQRQIEELEYKQKVEDDKLKTRHEQVLIEKLFDHKSKEIERIDNA